MAEPRLTSNPNAIVGAPKEVVVYGKKIIGYDTGVTARTYLYALVESNVPVTMWAFLGVKGGGWRHAKNIAYYDADGSGSAPPVGDKQLWARPNGIVGQLIGGFSHNLLAHALDETAWRNVFGDPMKDRDIHDPISYSGLATSFTPRSRGYLYLCMNDALNYGGGNGYGDNEGEIQLIISGVSSAL